MRDSSPEAVIDSLVRNAYVITMDAQRRVFPQGYVAIDKGQVVQVGRMDDGPLPAAHDVIDARGGVVMPGMINGHNHLVQNAFRGYNDDRWPVLDIPVAVRSLLEQLFAMSAYLDEERTYALVRLHALELLKNGYTATHDEHFTNVLKTSVDGSWQAIADSGLRGFLCRCIVDDRVPESGRESAEEGLREVERLRRFGSDRLTVAASFVNYSFLADPEDMRRIRQGARDLGVAFGVDMTDNSRGAMLKARGFEREGVPLGQVDYYREYGLLEDGPIYAGKGVNLLPHEYAILAEHDARTGLVPTLRFFDGQGLPIHDFLAAGMLPGLGTDAPLVSDTQDPFEVMRHAIFAQNIAVKQRVAAGGERPVREHWAVAETTLEMMTLGGARSLLMEHSIGALEPGKQADLVVIDTARADFAPTHGDARLVGSLVWGGKGAQVDTVMIAGEILVQGGRSTTWDEATIVAEADRAMAGVVREAGLASYLPSRRAGETYRGWTYC